ncbi:MAG: hypothetical protein NUV53_00875 [Patescibacteria group bacterium]|nr:hypothetical protein [Patescibacteria group bacterium]
MNRFDISKKIKLSKHVRWIGGGILMACAVVVFAVMNFQYEAQAQSAIANSGRQVRYPFGTSKVTLNWATWGSGEFARAFRKCRVTVNATDSKNKGGVATSTLCNTDPEGFPVSVTNGAEYKATINVESIIPGAVSVGGAPLVTNDNIAFIIDDKPEGATSTPALPKPPERPAPNYREL